MEHGSTREPLVSVVMPVYNSAQYLCRTLDSVLHQTFSNLELLIVYDDSQDDTLEIINRYADTDDRVRILKNKAGRGVSEARNTGIEAASGDFVAFADSDDIWETDKVRRQIELQKKTGAPLVYSSYDFIDQDGRFINRPYIVPATTNYKKQLIENAIGTSTVLVTAPCIKNYRFRSDFYQEDYILWLEILRDNDRACGERDVLVHYRMSRGSRGDNKFLAAKSRWKVYREFLKLSVIKSLTLWVPYCLLAAQKYALAYVTRRDGRQRNTAER